MSLTEQQEFQVPYKRTSIIDVTDKLPFVPPCKVVFKKETEQPCGSFKLRGIGYMIGKSVTEIRNSNPRTPIQVFASSGGNAGLAAAYSSQFYNIKCIVAVPIQTKQVIINSLKQYGSDVIIFGNTINEADKYLRTKMAATDSSIHKVYCHPFENELVWHGHSSIIDELRDCHIPNEKIKGIVCSIGGGGLYNGLFHGLQKNQMKSDLLIIETDEAPTFAETVKRGEVFTLDNVKSVATSLACSYLSGQSLKNYYSPEIKTVFESIPDKDAVKAVIDYFDTFGEIVEPACGAATCVALNRSDILRNAFPNVSKDDVIVVIVCGGSCTDEKGLEEFRSMVSKSKF